MSEINGHIIIDRIRDNGIQTIGQAWALVNGSKKLDFVTLEPSWVLNMPFISCAALGTYDVVKRHSSNYGDHFKLLNVEGRSMMLIHTLNFFNETEGCIGPGERFQLLDNNQFVDVINSGNVMRKLNDIMPEKFRLTIKQNDDFQRMYCQCGRWTVDMAMMDDQGHKEIARSAK